MAISWGLPKLVSKILEAVPAINYLLNALAKMDYTGTEDVPIGAVRLESLSGGYQLQRYNGTSWVSVGKLIHDAETVDGKSASTTATADTIPVRDSSGKVPGDITGNAATASSASALSTTLAISKGGTGATSASAARSNLGVPSTSHASSDTTYGLSSATVYGHAMAASDAPAQDTDTGSVGSDVTHFARGDHAHKKVLGTSSVYGQVKLTDSVSDGSDASSSVAASSKAVKTAYDAATTTMTGATATTAGTSGRTPEPGVGDQNKALFGDATYKAVVQSVGGTAPDASGNVAAPYLPLAGGTVTGKLTVQGVISPKNNIYADTLDRALTIGVGATWDDAPSLSLYGPDVSSGIINGFELRAGTNTYNLRGYSSGTLIWGGKNIVRSVNGVNADEDGNVNVLSITSYKTGIPGYFKYKNGMIVQWGTYSYNSSIGSQHANPITVSFPTAFTSATYSLQANVKVPGDGNPCYVSIVTRSTSSFRATIFAHNLTTNVVVMWTAIGK